jgi:anti-anti-sigma factor
MIECNRSGQVLRIAGELTIYHAAEAKVRLQEELASDPVLEVDLAAVEELDTAGAQLLLWLKREGRARGVAIPFLNHSPAVLEVLEQLNLTGHFGDTILISPTS